MAHAAIEALPSEVTSLLISHLRITEAHCMALCCRLLRDWVRQHDELHLNQYEQPLRVRVDLFRHFKQRLKLQRPPLRSFVVAASSRSGISAFGFPVDAQIRAIFHAPHLACCLSGLRVLTLKGFHFFRDSNLSNARQPEDQRTWSCVARSLPAMPNLRRLTLDRLVPQESLLTLMRGLAHCPNLHHCELQRHLPSPSVCPAVEATHQCGVECYDALARSLKLLDLSQPSPGRQPPPQRARECGRYWTPIPMSTASTVVQIIGRCAQLQTLDVSGALVATIEFCNAVTQLPCLRELYANDVNLGRLCETTGSATEHPGAEAELSMAALDRLWSALASKASLRLVQIARNHIHQFLRPSAARRMLQALAPCAHLTLTTDFGEWTAPEGGMWPAYDPFAFSADRRLAAVRLFASVAASGGQPATALSVARELRNDLMQHDLEWLLRKRVWGEVWWCDTVAMD